jgi:membrane associated rhomboid family serine protease
MDSLPNAVPLTILGVTVIMSLIALHNPLKMGQWVLSPYIINQNGSYSRFITSGLIHADYGHLFFNMISFYFFAFALEEQLGPVRFAVLYFASMIFADIPTFIKYKNNPSYASLGASGAVSAVIFGYILYYPMNKIYIMFVPMGIPAFIFAILYLAYCIWAAKRHLGNINHSAHFWGALSGVALVLIHEPLALKNCIEQIRSSFFS